MARSCKKPLGYYKETEEKKDLEVDDLCDEGVFEVERLVERRVIKVSDYFITVWYAFLSQSHMNSLGTCYVSCLGKATQKKKLRGCQ